MPRLGCASEYRVVITDRCRSGTSGRVLTEITDKMLSLEWGRTLNEISTAQVRLAPGCCDILAEVRQGRDMLVFRDGELVWNGELMSDPVDCRESATVTAFDRWGILSKRVLHHQHCYRPKCGGRSTAVGTVVMDLIEDGLSGDDRCAKDFVQWIGRCGTQLTRQFDRWSDYVLELVDNLAESRIDYTSVGDRLLVFCKGQSIGQTATLLCQHFASDVCVGSIGALSTTHVVVKGDGVFGEAGGSDPYYGLLEALVEDDSIKTTEAAMAEARALLRARRPPRYWVDTPDGSELTYDAPVSIHDLVPGVTVPVALDCLCTPLNEVMRLVDVKVTYTAGEGGGSGGSGEKVAITLASPVETDISGEDGEI